MTARIRVLHVIQNLNVGGMERLIAEMARRADTSRFDTHVMALQHLGHFSQGLDAFATLHVANPMTRGSMLRPIALARQFRDIAPDVIHSHGGVWYKASLAATIAGIPSSVHTDHGRRTPDPWLHRRIDRRASRRTEVIVAVSDVLAQQLRAFVAYPDRVRVVVNGVDTERYAPHTYDGFLHRELGLDPTTPILGSIGRLEAIKGYEIMVAAFAKFRERYDGPVRPILALIGNGRQKQALVQLATSLGLLDDIRFLGWRSDIEQCLGAFTLFTMSSHSEGTSVSLLESMSAGLCPIVTEVGGNQAVLGTSLHHRLVPPANPDALANAWIDALRDPERLSNDAAVARQRVISDFALDVMVDQYGTIYQELQQRHHTRKTRHLSSV